MPRLSVIVCTYNRSEDLDRCLASLLDQDLPHDELEVLVVDNGSTDDTPTVLARWSARMANLRPLCEPQLGLSRARNTGLAAAGADVVAFLDDDAAACPGWARAVVGAFEARPGLTGVAGRIVLEWPGGSPPAWYDHELGAWFAELDLGDAAHDLRPPRLPFGANMAVRTEAAREVGGFATELGRTGRSLLSNEEEAFFAGLRAGGASIAYVPDATVRHYVSEERTSLLWLFRRAYAGGRSLAVMSQLSHDGAAPTRREAAEKGARAVARALLKGWSTTVADVTAADRRLPAAVVAAVQRTQPLGFGVEYARAALRGRADGRGRGPSGPAPKAP